MATDIQWTDETWNFLAGCSPVSEGCRNCYAAQVANIRQHNPQPVMQAKYSGTAEMRGLGKARRAVFTGRVNFHEPTLMKPFGWKKPRRVFVNSMSDLFHESVSFEIVDRAMAVMALTPRHTYQILTKRPERAAEYFSDPQRSLHVGLAAFGICLDNVGKGWGKDVILTGEGDEAGRLKVWPLPNVWIGTSVEDQESADERIPHLLWVPAAVRFLSCEPLLGPVDLWSPRYQLGAYSGRASAFNWGNGVSWVIVGGESGPHSRPFDVGWARAIVRDCRGADVPVFVKQLGAVPLSSDEKDWNGRRIRIVATGNGLEERAALTLRDKKGGDPEEWPEDLRVREFPEVAHA